MRWYLVQIYRAIKFSFFVSARRRQEFRGTEQLFFSRILGGLHGSGGRRSFWGDKGADIITRHRLAYLYQLLGYENFVADLDTAWLQTRIRLGYLLPVAFRACIPPCDVGEGLSRPTHFMCVRLWLQLGGRRFLYCWSQRGSRLRCGRHRFRLSWNRGAVSQ